MGQVRVMTRHQLRLCVLDSGLDVGRDNLRAGNDGAGGVFNGTLQGGVA